MSTLAGKIIGNWLASTMLASNLEIDPNRLTDTQRIQLYEIAMLEDRLPDYVLFQQGNFSTPEQEQVAQQMTSPKNKEDEEKIYQWAHALRIELVFMENPLGRKEERAQLIKKMQWCIDNLLKYNDKDWKYWYLYAKINSMEMCKNPEEASKGYENARKLKKNVLKEYSNTREERLADEILYTKKLTIKVLREIKKSKKKWDKYTREHEGQ